MVEFGVGVVGTESSRSCAAVVCRHLADLYALRLDQLFAGRPVREPFFVQALVTTMKVLPVLVLMLGLSHVAYAQAIEPRDLLEVVDFSGPVVSPNGKLVAFRVEQASIERNTYDAFWYVQDVDGGVPPHRIAGGGEVLRDFVGDPLSATVVWSPDNRWIYYRAMVDGKVDVWRAAVDGSGAEPMTHDAADVRDFALGKKGRVLRYSVGATREEVR